MIVLIIASQLVYFRLQSNLFKTVDQPNSDPSPHSEL